MEKKLKNPLFSLGIILIVISIAILIVAIAVGGKVLKLEQNGIETTATITDIRSSYGNDNHTVYVSFDVDGNEINTELNYYSSSMRVGDTVTIIYSLDDPHNVIKKGAWILTLLGPAIVFVVLFAIGCTFTVKEMRQRGLAKRIKATGTKKTAVVKSYDVNTKVRINSRNPLCLIAADEEGNTYKTGNLNLQRYEADKYIGYEMDLYVSAFIGEGKYYLDVGTLRPAADGGDKKTGSSYSSGEDFFGEGDKRDDRPFDKDSENRGEYVDFSGKN